MALPELLTNSPIPGTNTPLGTLSATMTDLVGLSMSVSALAPAVLRAATGQFRVVVDNEVMLIAASATGVSPWTILQRGAEGSTATTHASGASVYHYLTAAALGNVVSSHASRVRNWGSSLASGANLTNRESRYCAIVAGELGAQEVSYGISGAHIALLENSGAQPGGVSTVKQRAVIDARCWAGTSGYGPQGDVECISSAVNDMLRGSSAGNVAWVKEATRAIFSHLSMAGGLDLGAATVPSQAVFTGTWTRVANPTVPPLRDNGTYCAAQGFGYRWTSTLNDSFTVQLPGNYPGSARCPVAIHNVVLAQAGGTGTISVTGIPNGPVTFDISSPNLTDTANAYNNAQACRLKGLTSAATDWIPPGNGAPRTLTITLTAVGGSQKWGVDYVGIEADSNLAQAKILQVTPHLGGPYTQFWNAIDAARVALYKAAYVALAAEFNNVLLIDGDTVLTPPQAVTQMLTTAIVAASAASIPINVIPVGFPTTGLLRSGGNIISYTGYTGGAGAAGTFTGCVWGQYNSIAVGLANGDPVVNTTTAGALNFNAAEGVHYSEAGHQLIADAMMNALGVVGSASRSASRRHGTPTFDGTCRAFYDSGSAGGVVTGQPVYPNYQFGQTKIFWNRKRRDAADMLGTSYYNATDITIGADRTYQVRCSVTFDPNDLGGTRIIRLIRVRADGGGTESLARSWLPVSFASSPNPAELQLAWTGSLRAGDIIYFDAAAYGINSQIATTLSAAITDNVGTTFSAAASIPAASTVRIDNEVFTTSAVSGAGPYIITASRGAYNSYVSSHSNGASIIGGGAIIYGNNTAGGDRHSCEMSVEVIGAFEGSTFT